MIDLNGINDLMKRLSLLPKLDLTNMNQLLTEMDNLLNHNLNTYLNQQSYATQMPASSTSNIPLQLWESDESIYLLASLPGIKSIKEIQVKIEDPQTVVIKGRIGSLKPEPTCRILHSEIAMLQELERKIQLPSPVATKSFTTNFADGILTIKFNKEKDEIDDSYFDE
jgi:HSP20 family molecular chaperone IbpA